MKLQIPKARLAYRQYHGAAILASQAGNFTKLKFPSARLINSSVFSSSQFNKLIFILLSRPIGQVALEFFGLHSYKYDRLRCGKKLGLSTAYHRSRYPIPVLASGLTYRSDFTLEGLERAIGGSHVGITANASIHQLPILSRLLGRHVQSPACR